MTTATSLFQRLFGVKNPLLHWMLWAIFQSVEKKKNPSWIKRYGERLVITTVLGWWTNYSVKQSFTKEEKRLCQNQNGKNRRLGCLDMYSSFLKHVITESTRYQSLLHLPHERFHRVIIHHTSSKGVKTFSMSPGNYIMKEMCGICPFPKNPECLQIFCSSTSVSGAGSCRAARGQGL